MKTPTLACGKMPGVHGDLGVTAEQGGPMTAARISSGGRAGGRRSSDGNTKQKLPHNSLLRLFVHI